MGVLIAAQPLRCLLFQPGGYGKSAVRAGYRDALHRLLGIEGVVGRFLGDIDVVGVGLFESGGGDLHELGLGVQLLHVVAAGVAHTGPQAAHELVDGVAGGAL